LLREINNAPAIELLANHAAVANQISDKLFAQVQYQQPPSMLEITSFSDDFESRMNKYAVDQRFNDFYDYNHPVRKVKLQFFRDSQSRLLMSYLPIVELIHYMNLIV
jgi:hypothetical protein